MRFHTRIGVLAHEATLPQPLEIDLTVWRDADHGPGVLDYGLLYALVERALGSEHTQYLEDVAERVAAAAMGMAEVAGLRVAVRKPHVLLPGPLAYAEVVLERERNG
jgi:dihydroneopterin aldolase